jgi:hypothetical protein
MNQGPRRISLILKNTGKKSRGTILLKQFSSANQGEKRLTINSYLSTPICF